MGWGGGTGTELMPELVVGYTELDGGMLKKGNGFLQPNFELLPKLSFDKQPNRLNL